MNDQTQQIQQLVAYSGKFSHTPDETIYGEFVQVTEDGQIRKTIISNDKIGDDDFPGINKFMADINKMVDEENAKSPRSPHWSAKRVANQIKKDGRINRWRK